MKLYYPVLEEETEFIINWVNERLPEPEDFGKSYSLALVDDDTKIHAAAVYSGYARGNVFLSVAVERSGIRGMTKSRIAAMLSVAFDEPLNCRRITTLVPTSNIRSIVTTAKMGFREEGLLREFFGSEDAIVFGMTKTEFIGGAYGRRQNRQWRRAS